MLCVQPEAACGSSPSLSILPRNISKYFSRMASVVGQKAPRLAPALTSAARCEGFWFGSERLPAREKNCSMLASCGRCDAACLKMVKWRGKRSRRAHLVHRFELDHRAEVQRLLLDRAHAALPVRAGHLDLLAEVRGLVLNERVLGDLEPRLRRLLLLAALGRHQRRRGAGWLRPAAKDDPFWLFEYCQKSRCLGLFSIAMSRT